MNEMFDEYIEKARDEWKNVGLAVAVVKGSDVVYARGFGRRQADAASAVDADTLFQVGSTTKAFSAAALGMLADAGRLHWDDAVIEHLPDFALQDAWLTREVTIRDTLSHRCGIGDDSYHPFLGLMSSADAVKQLRYIPQTAAFRDSHLYSNLMYAVAGKVIEAAAGMSWGEFVNARLLDPLRMKRSGTSANEFWSDGHVTSTFLGSAPLNAVRMHEALDANVAMPHGWDSRGRISVLPWRTYDNAAAAGAIVSCAADMANWLILNLNGGTFAGRRLIGENTLRELHAVQNLRIDCNQFPFEETTETYALGWRRTTYRGGTYLAHGGGIIGFPAYMALLPEHKLGVVVLSNGSQAARERLGFYKVALHKIIVFGVLDRLLGAEPRDWSQEFRERALLVERDVERREAELQSARLRDVSPSVPLSRYAGRYKDVARYAGTVHVSIEGEGLMLRFAGDGAYAARLDHWHAGMFRVHSSVGVADILDPQFATFALDAHGTVTSMTAFGATFQKISGESER